VYLVPAYIYQCVYFDADQKLESDSNFSTSPIGESYQKLEFDSNFCPRQIYDICVYMRTARVSPRQLAKDSVRHVYATTFYR